MGTGPRVSQAYDLLLTEVVGEGEHHFLCEAGSEAGVLVPANYLATVAEIAQEVSFLAGETLFVAGPPAIRNEQTQEVRPGRDDALLQRPVRKQAVDA